MIRSDLNVARERNQRLYAHAAPVMHMLFEQIVNTESMIVLTDAQGTILHSVGDDEFLGWSQAWRLKMRDERAQQLLTVDPHAPPEFRANGAAVNHDGFHAAFGTRPGDRMYKAPAERIRIC